MTERKRKIKNMESLLQNIAAGLNRYDECRVCNLEVVLFEGELEVLHTDLQTVLDYLANDIYWNEVSNWSLADRAEVRSL